MTRRIIAITLLAVAVVAAAGLAFWRINLDERSRYTDAATINAPVSTAPIRHILWQPASPVADAADASADQYEPRVSADGQFMIFVRGRARGERTSPTNADFFQSRRTHQGWTTPEPVKALNSDADELGPELSADGRTLYFYSDRAGGRGGYDLWLSRRDDGGDWSEPVNLGAELNTEFNEYGPALTPDGKRLFFSSNRPRPGDPPELAQRDPWAATLRENRSRHDYDLYLVDLQPESAAADRHATDTAATSPGSTPAPLTILNTAHDEGAPALSPVGDFLYFASNRPGGQGAFDIYRARILRGEIQPPESLGTAINSERNDLDPSLSTDGFRIYFSSDRVAQPSSPSDAPTPPSIEAPRYSLYASASREVFIETQPLQASALLRLWQAAWPWLLSLLGALILAVLFYLAMRDAAIRHRIAQLSLMAKCLLISLLLHAMLLSAFAAWRVGTAIGDMLRDGGRGQGNQVSIASTAAASGSLESQIRGTLTTASIDAPTIEAARPQASPLDLQTPTIQLATTPANLSYTLAPVLFTPQDSTSPAASPALSPQLAQTTLSSRAPAAEDAPAPSSELRSELAPDTASFPVRAPSINPAALTPAAITLNPVAAPIAAPTSTLPAALHESIPSLAGGTPTPLTPPQLASSTPTAINSRLPQASPGAASTAEPSSPSVALDASVPPHAQPSIPGAAAASTVSIAPPAAHIRPAPAPSFTPSDAPSTSLSSAPSAGPTTPNLPSMAAAVVASRLPGASTPAPKASHEEPSASSTLTSPGNIATPSRPSLNLGVAPTAASIQLAPTQTNSPAPASAPFAATEAPAASAPSASPATPGRTTDLSRLPAITLKPALPPVPTEIPKAELPRPENFAQRAPEVRDEVLKKTGGSPETERAVAAALTWFANHQSADGRWSGQHFDRDCSQCSSPAEIDADAAMTGITLLCFLGSGHTHQSDTPHRDSVRKALSWLVNRTTSTGDLRQGETMYSQTIAAIALCEAFAMTRDPWLESPARRAITFVARGSNRSGSSETSVLGWQIMAVKSAQRAGFDVPTTAFDAARRWLDQVSNPLTPGRYAYRPGEAPSPAATAEAMFVQQLLGHSREEDRMKQSADFILTAPPAWGGKDNRGVRRDAPTYYWYYATLCLFQQQGEHWKTWNEGLARELLKNQRQDGPAKGSWDPQDQWSRLGGRIYQTAVCTLSLEVYYRYRLNEP